MHNDSESEIEEGPLSEYEKQRLENVERNKKRFQEMNLSSFDQFLQAKKKETENKKSVSNFYDSVTRTTFPSGLRRLAFSATCLQ